MLELDALRKRYGATTALDDLTMTVRPGGMFGFVGTNGAGKTTAMRIVMGVLEADGGQVRWQGRALDSQARRAFGYMPEERGLYPRMRVREQLVYLARLRGLPEAQAGSAADALLERLGLTGRAQDRVEALSLGNQQRVQLAAALTHDPALLVLDEPFSGLDPVGVDALADVLRERVEAGVVVVFSSHQLDLVERLCHEVGIIRAGRSVAAGPVDALRSGGRSRRLRVVVEERGAVRGGAPAGGGGAAAWVEDPALRAAGVRVVAASGSETVVEVPAGPVEHEAAVDELVLDRARAAGAVRAFVPEVPRLVDLFREAVADVPDDPDATDARERAEVAA